MSRLILFLILFFIVWTIRATVFIGIDESISSPTLRVAYSNMLKFAFWVLPAVVFAFLKKKEPPARYLGITTMPDLETWNVCFIVSGLYLTVVLVIDLTVGGKVFSAAKVISLPVTLFFLQFVASSFFEEILFRGLVLKELLAISSLPLASVITSLLFVGAHLPYWISHGGFTSALLTNVFGVFLFSIVACWLYAKSRSIWPPTVIHVGNNVLTFLLNARES